MKLFYCSIIGLIQFGERRLESIFVFCAVKLSPGTSLFEVVRGRNSYSQIDGRLASSRRFAEKYFIIIIENIQ